MAVRDRMTMGVAACVVGMLVAAIIMLRWMQGNQRKI